jgi:hypothetical protein
MILQELTTRFEGMMEGYFLSLFLGVNDHFPGVYVGVYIFSACALMAPPYSSSSSFSVR